MPLTGAWPEEVVAPQLSFQRQQLWLNQQVVRLRQPVWMTPVSIWLPLQTESGLALDLLLLPDSMAASDFCQLRAVLRFYMQPQALD